MESKKRSIAKTISWRLVATIITWITLYLIVGIFIDSLKLTIITAITNVIGYYIHERLWNQSNWERYRDI